MTKRPWDIPSPQQVEEQIHNEAYNRAAQDISGAFRRAPDRTKVSFRILDGFDDLPKGLAKTFLDEMRKVGWGVYCDDLGFPLYFFNPEPLQYPDPNRVAKVGL